MTRTSGFTLIELVITITIMAALVTLAVVSLRSTQATARDEQRATDVTAIAQALEGFYTGNFNTGFGFSKGYYPPTYYFSTKQSILDTLRDLSPTAIYAPGIAESGTPSLVGAAGAGSQSPNIDTYIYQPLKSDGTLCSQSSDGCRKFNLYYREEATNQVQTVTSKNR